MLFSFLRVFLNILVMWCYVVAVFFGLAKKSLGAIGVGFLFLLVYEGRLTVVLISPTVSIQWLFN